MTKIGTRRLVESAILIGISTALVIVSSLFPLSLPFGGSVTFMSMLPVILISYRYGIKWGIFCGFVFSIVHMLTGFKSVSAFFLPGDNQMALWKALLVCLLDYVLAFTAVGLGGLFRNKFKNPALALSVGAIASLSITYLMHFISGVLFYGAWAEWFFTQDSVKNLGAWVLEHMSGFSLAAFYSLIYNGLYMVPEIIITVIGAVIVSKIPSIRKKMS